MLRGQHRSQTFGAGPVMGFSGKKAKSEFRPWWESEVGNPTSVEESRPRRGLGRAPMPGRWRGREAMPDRHQAAEPSQSPGSLLYVLYVLYGSHKASHGSLLYVLYVLYLTRQATEHPLSPGSLLYVLYVLYLSTSTLPGFLATGAICAIR